MKIIRRESIYTMNRSSLTNVFQPIINYIDKQKMVDEDIFFWDGLECLDIPFGHEFQKDIYTNQWNEFHDILDEKNINLYAVGGDYYNKAIDFDLKPYPRIKVFRWKTALLHYINYTVSKKYSSDDVRITPKFTKLFNFLNRHPRDNRLILMDSLYEKNLFDYGDISWNIETSMWNSNPYKLKFWKEEIKKLDMHGNSEFYEDEMINPDGTISYCIRDSILLTDYILNSGCLFSLSCESIPNHTSDVYFITEKTWRPIILGQPSIVIANHYYKTTMEEMGFKFYDNIISDKAYGDKNILEGEMGSEFWEKISSRVLDDLSKLKDENYQQIYESIKDVVEHNRNRAFEIINDDPYIEQSFVDFYFKNKKHFDSDKELLRDIDLKNVFKNKNN